MEKITEKSWFEPENSLTAVDTIVDAERYQWSDKSAIYYYQIQQVIKDEDVLICDIEARDSHPIVYIEWVG